MQQEESRPATAFLSLTRWWSFLKYCMTGGLNTAVSYIVYAVGIGVLHLTSSIALAISYLVGMVTSFVLNTLWTFEKASVQWSYIWKFLAVNLVLLLGSEGGLHLLTTGLHLSPYLAQLVNLIPFTLLGFVLNKRFVYGQSKETPVDNRQF